MTDANSPNASSSTASGLATAILEVGRRAHSEEDVRVGVERALAGALQALGLTGTPEYEKTTFSGSADAVYGHVTIEYKRPGRLGEKGFPARLAQQIARYLTDHARAEADPARQAAALEKMIGVGLDAQQILFVRYAASGRRRDLPVPALPRSQVELLAVEGQSGGFQVTGPVPITRESVDLLLLYLRSLSRKPLTPQALAGDFGPEGAIAPRLVQCFYEALQTHRSHPRVATFFSEWDRIFGIVYGEELGEAQKDAGELAGLYRIPVATAAPELRPLFFAVHTYYALLMKLLAVELASLQGGALVGSLVGALPAAPDPELRRALGDLENGGTFSLLGINNFLEGDFLGWYLDIWSQELADGIRTMGRALAEFEPATTTLEPEHTRDLLKKLYQYLVPRKLRHDLGEYYTPDWLAERLLNQVGYRGDPARRLIDPGCGSGTFLVLALRRLRQFAADHLTPPAELLEAVLQNVIGFDLNPLSVIAARTNYLLALGDLLRYRRGPVDLPVYLCDSILAPTERADIFGKSYRLHTVVGDFEVPGEIVSAGQMGALSALLERCVRDEYAPEEFLARARRELSPRQPMTETVLEALYRRLLDLQQQGRDGIWARLLKNAFAPVLVGQFDFVVGNPPWVNWESLSAEYREATKPLWIEYGLFSLKGHAARLGGGKKDLAMLFAYAATDHYLKRDGRLGFVMTQTVFKTKGAGDGFRRLRLGKEGDLLRVTQVDDLSRLQPFEGASNRTSVMVWQRGQETRYPVAYTLWQKGKGSARVDIGKTLPEVLAETERADLWAEPVNAKVQTSPWMAARKPALKALRKVIGAADYRGYEGANTGGANGVFWLQVLACRPDGLVIVSNLADVGRKSVPTRQGVVEPDFVYPLLRGRDTTRWRSVPSLRILMVQNPEARAGYAESWLKLERPETYRFLNQFKEVLAARALYKLYFDPKKDPFYSMYNVADYTFAPYKVVWSEVANSLDAAVVSTHHDEHLGEKLIIPDHTLILVPCQTACEAHFVCACLNAVPGRLIVEAYVALHPSPHVLDHIAIPEYSRDNPVHLRLSALSRQAHDLATAGDEAGLATVEEQVDLAAAELWDITPPELREIRRSLAVLAS